MIPSPFRTDPLTPEFVHPSQFYPSRATSGEHKLLLAVLEEALACLCAPLPRGKYGVVRAQRLRQEARDWITSEDTQWPFAFLTVCGVLGLDAGGIRTTVLREGFKLQTQGFRNNQVAGPPPKVGTRELLDDIDLAVQQQRRKKERAWPRRGDHPSVRPEGCP